ncbi:MAG TPA: sigma factor [Bryobacteraceae bacterium]|nr:sigma factor [Bryobacteraceae bacterium]
MERFPTTEWSMIAAAQGTETPDARLALERICSTYWYPVYAFIRSRTAQAADAEDLTQGFFASLIGAASIDSVRPERGRFRAFLLASAKNYLAGQRERRLSQKRGGMATFLDFDAAERRYSMEAAPGSDPETEFERSWARTAVELAEETLRREYASTGKAVLFEALLPYLRGGAGPPYACLAAALEISESAIKAAVLRVRRRFGRILTRQIASTVGPNGNAATEEVKYLLRLLSR